MACGESQSGGEDAVVGARGTATLEVAEDDSAGLDPGQVLDLAGDDVADPAESAVAEGVERFVKGDGAALGELGPLRRRRRCRSSCRRPVGV